MPSAPDFLMNAEVASYWNFSLLKGYAYTRSATSLPIRFRPSHTVRVPHTLSSLPPRTSTMASTSQTQKGRHGVRSTLSAAIKVISLAKDACHGIPPAQVAFGIAGALLTMIRVFSPLPLRCLVSDPRLSRTHWPTNRISSILGEHAPMSARFSTGG